MKFMSFEEWLKNNPDLDNNRFIDCPECQGVGKFEEVDDYGNVATIYCYVCEGEGKINETYEEYEYQLKKDKLKYEKHVELQNQLKGE